MPSIIRWVYDYCKELLEDRCRHPSPENGFVKTQSRYSGYFYHFCEGETSVGGIPWPSQKLTPLAIRGLVTRWRLDWIASTVQA